jgi:hypothetical protein
MLRFRSIAITGQCCNIAAMADHTLTLEQVAGELHMQPRTLRRRWRSLHQQQGFPRPLPGLGLVWSKLLVVAWLRGSSLGVTPAANDDAVTGPDAAGLIEAQRQALRAAIRAGG